MSLTFAFIGNRADIGEWLPEAHADALVLESGAGRSLSWGVGFFQTDEVLLRRKPNDTSGALALWRQFEGVRSHAVLAHICHTSAGALRTETTPPLRFGHIVFACQGTHSGLAAIRSRVEASLPDFLRAGLKGDTFTELAFSIFLRELPRAELERTWQTRTASPPSGPIAPEVVHAALRRTLRSLDELAVECDVERFTGGLWVNTGENLFVAHRTGLFGMRLYRGSAEFESISKRTTPLGAEHAHFTVLLAGETTLPVGWERLPDDSLLTAYRTAAPEIQKLRPL